MQLTTLKEKCSERKREKVAEWKVTVLPVGTVRHCAGYGHEGRLCESVNDSVDTSGRLLVRARVRVESRCTGV